MPDTPMTEAGRWLLSEYRRTPGDPKWHPGMGLETTILAIEQEARAEALRRVEALIVKELPCNLLGCERMGTHIDEDDTPLWYCEDHRSPPWAPGREFPPDPSRIAILAVIREET